MRTLLAASTFARGNCAAGNFAGVATDPVILESKRNPVDGVITIRLSTELAIQFNYLFRKDNHENLIHQ